MGHSFLVGFWGSHMAQACLLTACVFLCLQPVTAIKCKSCTVEKPGQPCIPIGKTCQMNGAVCMAMKFYSGNVLERKVLSCFVDTVRTCGKKGILPTSGQRYEHVCCSNKDYCNNNL
ncbi:uncharacterized protein LOC143834533 isoform X1 [Paroedura picta]|uniref:uncharacterized protein LOC143831569 n=1 Tax=Paroedura picta TaxID=143630 RepID=UPI0040566EC6